jgi:hypothetical protein
MRHSQRPSQDSIRHAAPGIATRLIALISRFSDDSRANLAVIFAITLIPVQAAVGVRPNTRLPHE